MSALSGIPALAPRWINLSYEWIRFVVLLAGVLFLSWFVGRRSAGRRKALLWMGAGAFVCWLPALLWLAIQVYRDSALVMAFTQNARTLEILLFVLLRGSMLSLYAALLGGVVALVVLMVCEERRADHRRQA